MNTQINHAINKMESWIQEPTPFLTGTATDMFGGEVHLHKNRTIITADYTDETIAVNQFFAEVRNGRKRLGPHASTRNWRRVDADDMKTFLGLVLFMGTAKFPAYDIYWSNNWMLNLGIKGVMSRDKFLMILSFLHCADNKDMPARDDQNYDRLYKICHVKDLFTDSWQAAYDVEREVSLDETVMAFKGTSTMKNYNPAKAHKWGLPVWSLAKATSGYVYHWDVYTGKKTDPRTQNNVGRGTVHWTVMDSL